MWCLLDTNPENLCSILVLVPVPVMMIIIAYLRQRGDHRVARDEENIGFAYVVHALAVVLAPAIAGVRLPVDGNEFVAVPAFA